MLSSRWHEEVKGSGLLLGVELVLQLHEFARSFDLVGNLLPLREETLALLEGQTLRSAAGDRVLLLLTAAHTHSVGYTNIQSEQSEIFNFI